MTYIRKFDKSKASDSYSGQIDLLHYMESLNELEWESLLNDVILEKSTVCRIFKKSPDSEIVSAVAAMIEMTGNRTKQLIAKAMTKIIHEATDFGDFFKNALFLSFRLPLEVLTYRIRELLILPELDQRIRRELGRLLLTDQSLPISFWECIDMVKYPELTSVIMTAVAPSNPRLALSLPMKLCRKPPFHTSCEPALRVALRLIIKEGENLESVKNLFMEAPEWYREIGFVVLNFREFGNDNIKAKRNSRESEDDTAIIWSKTLVSFAHGESVPLPWTQSSYYKENEDLINKSIILLINQFDSLTSVHTNTALRIFELANHSSDIKVLNWSVKELKKLTTGAWPKKEHLIPVALFTIDRILNNISIISTSTKTYQNVHDAFFEATKDLVTMPEYSFQAYSTFIKHSKNVMEIATLTGIVLFQPANDGQIFLSTLKYWHHEKINLVINELLKIARSEIKNSNIELSVLSISEKLYKMDSNIFNYYDDFTLTEILEIEDNTTPLTFDEFVEEVITPEEAYA